VTGATPRTLPFEPAASLPNVIAGQRAGDYVVEGELGRGGMGVVYKARQTSLNRAVALKMLLHADHAPDEAFLRFRREAEALARLRHPNVVQVYDVGEWQAGGAVVPFFAMEYVGGGSLDRRLGAGPLPPRAAAELVEVLARALHAAHQVGIVHRDLKPANVLLANGGGERPGVATPERSHPPLAGLMPKVGDFGLARWADERTRLSASGALLGTPSYMAPEQARGLPADHRTDVYALGAILFECLTGRPPFRSNAVADMLVQVLHDEPPSPRRLRPEVPRDLATVCLKCLRKEPGQRYTTAEDLGDDLRRFLRGEPVRARPVGVLGRLLRWARRRPGVAALWLVLLAVVAGGGLLVRSLWLQAEKSRGEVEQLRRELDKFSEALPAEKRAGFGKFFRDTWRDPRARQLTIYKALEDYRKTHPAVPAPEPSELPDSLSGVLVEEAGAAAPNMIGN
jgi:hypothetical protein